MNKYTTILVLLLITLSSCHHDKRIIPSSSEDIWKYHEYFLKTKEYQIFKIDSKSIKDWWTKNLDSNFIKNNLFRLDYDYWDLNPNLPIKYIHFHIIDTLQEIGNKLIITVFEFYQTNLAFSSKNYFIKIIAVEKNAVQSSYTLATHYEVTDGLALGKGGTNSIILHGKLILTREVRSAFALDLPDKDGSSHGWTTDITRFVTYNENLGKFTLLKQIRNEYSD
jgi:hypothetical protein